MRYFRLLWRIFLKLWTYWLFAVIMLALWLIFVWAVAAHSQPLVRAGHACFISYYDIETHNPALVVYQLEFSHFAGKAKVGTRHFKVDTKLPRPRVKDGDYTNTGFVRGHLCSAGDRDSDKAWLKETYLTSNMVPMTLVCNSGPWKMIEDSCRALAIAGHKLLIARGPLYNKAADLAANVIQTRVCITIPDGFFCFARCLDCGLRFSEWCRNARSGESVSVLQIDPGRTDNVLQHGCQGLENVVQFRNDERVGVLLQNILGSWSREEYEIITH